MIHRKLTIIVPVLILLLHACSGDPETAKQRLLETGDKYFERGGYKEAAIIYRRALQRDRRFGEAYYRLGLAELKLGRYLQALRAFQRAVELEPDNADAFAKLSELYLAAYFADPSRNRRLLVDLKELTQRAETHQTDPVEARRIRGFIALAEQNTQDAIAHFRTALKVDPSDQRLLLALIETLSDVGEFEEAEQLARTAIGNDKAFGPAYDALYFQFVKLNRAEDAEALVRQKCADNPGNIQFWLQLAAHYHRVGQPEKRDEVLTRLTGNPADFPTAHMHVGDFFMRIREFAIAVRQYEEGLHTSPQQQSEFRNRIAEGLAAQGRMAEALQMVEQVLEEDSENPEALVMRGALQLAGGDPAQLQAAINDFESTIVRMPRNAVLRFSLGSAYMANGDVDQALVQFEEAARLRADYIPPRYSLARVYLARGQHAKAVQLADEILAIEPGSVSAKLIRSGALLGMRELHQAREGIEAVIKDYPSNTDAQFLLAQLNVSESRYAAAEGVLRRLYESSPSDPRGLQGLVQLYVAQGRPEAAQRMLEEEVRKAPDAVNLRLAMASVAVQAKEYDRAIAEYKHILEKDPNSASVHLQLGTAYYHTGDFPSAETHYRKAKQLRPKDLIANLRLALLVGEAGRKEETKSLLEEILKLAPDNPIALNNLAFMMADSPDSLDEALTLAQRARSKAPNNAKIADTLGWIYLKKKLSDNAIQVYSDLVVKDPSHITWRYNLALALFQKGDKPRARRELQTALQNRPSEEEEAKIRDLLSKVGT